MSIKAKQSDLQMVYFTVPEMELHWVLPDESMKETAIRTLFTSYEITFDLEATQPAKDDPSEFLVYLETRVNHGDNPLSGYKLKMVGNGFFRIRNFDQHPEKVIHNFKTISAVSMMINTIRAALSDMTSYGPKGRYNLPAIDIVSLLEEKSAQESSTGGKVSKEPKGKRKAST